jgi:hypothetical protein
MDYMQNKTKLIDPLFDQQILEKINPTKTDYIDPFNRVISWLYRNYIKPNMMTIIVIIIIVLLLFYRYRVVKKKKETKEIELALGYSNDDDTPSETSKFMDFYNLQKELLREPRLKN